MPAEGMFQAVTTVTECNTLPEDVVIVPSLNC